MYPPHYGARNGRTVRSPTGGVDVWGASRGSARTLHAVRAHIFSRRHSGAIQPGSQQSAQIKSVRCPLSELRQLVVGQSGAVRYKDET